MHNILTEYTMFDLAGESLRLFYVDYNLAFNKYVNLLEKGVEVYLMYLSNKNVFAICDIKHINSWAKFVDKYYLYQVIPHDFTQSLIFTFNINHASIIPFITNVVNSFLEDYKMLNTELVYYLDAVKSGNVKLLINTNYMVSNFREAQNITKMFDGYLSQFESTNYLKDILVIKQEHKYSGIINIYYTMPLL